jgi:hypothetical protein
LPTQSAGLRAFSTVIVNAMAEHRKQTGQQQELQSASLNRNHAL